MVEFNVHPWEVLLWEVMIALNTGICLYLIWTRKKAEFKREAEG